MVAEKEAAKTESSDEKRKRMRSPAYPFINVEMAIKRAKQFFEKEQRNAAPLRVAIKHWGYEPKSSGGLQTAAALISYGLMTDEGQGEARKLKLTPNALRILLDTRADSEDRAEAIRTVALTPKIHQQLWRKWGNNLPSDENLRHTLILDWEPPFNPSVVDAFIKEYRDTIASAKPSDSDAVPLVEGDWDAEKQEEENDAAFIGNQDKGIKPLWNHQKTSKSGGANVKQDVFSVAEGEVVLKWPAELSQESIQDLKDWLKIMERKISRSAQQQKNESPD
jgi:hypothetical protein